MRVLVTGACGWTAASIVEAVTEAGHEVYGFDLPDVPCNARTQARLSALMHGTIESAHDIDLAVRSVDAIIHLAVSIGRDAYRSPGEPFAVNVLGTYNIFASALHHGVSKVVLMSEAAVHLLPHGATLDARHDWRSAPNVTLAWYAPSVSSSMHTSSDVSIANALAAATERLRAVGGDTPRLDAEILLAHVLGVGRAVLLTHPDRALTDEQRATYDVLIERRARGEPVAYLVGARDWYDLTLQVTPDVLVPRPETEGLFERALAWARARCARAAADVGTGSGALAIALARALPDATVYATDLSSAALDVARANARRIDPTLNLTFLHGDLLAPLPAAVDLIVANLPYIGEEEYTGLMSDVRLYEPRAALVGGPTGHELIAHLLDMAPVRLRPGGALFLELGPPQAAPALVAARAIFPDAAIRLDDDYAGLARYLVVDTG